MPVIGLEVGARGRSHDFCTNLCTRFGINKNFYYVIKGFLSLKDYTQCSHLYNCLFSSFELMYFILIVIFLFDVKDKIKEMSET